MPMRMRTTTPFWYHRSQNHPSLVHRFWNVAEKEDLRKLRHREAQRRYIAKKKLALRRIEQARAHNSGQSNQGQ